MTNTVPSSALSAQNLIGIMEPSLPKNSSPQLKSPYDAVALLSHACMISVGFKLIGLGEDHKIEAISEGSESQPLPSEWNSSSPDHFAFRYSHFRSSLHYLIKISRLGSRAIVNGLGINDEKVHSLDIPIRDFLSESSFPFTRPSSNDESALPTLFISIGRIADLAAMFKIRIIQKLAPSLQKEGYEDNSGPDDHPQTAEEARRRPAPGREGNYTPEHDPLSDDRLPPHAQPRPYNDPLADGPRRPFPAGEFAPPGFEDEHEILRPYRGGTMGERRPLNIGERDLYPPGLGPNDPLGRGGFGPRGGIDGGMHPTLDDPVFGGGGGGGYDPRAPPGARYDPIGPGDGPPNLRGGPRFPGHGGGFGGGGPPNPFGGFGGNDFV